MALEQRIRRFFLGTRGRVPHLPRCARSRGARPPATKIDAAQLTLLSIAVLGAACSSRIPARVELVDGHQVELATAGTGGAATVVFESGLGEDWTHWDEVASQVARQARIFAYSRPGYGASGPATTPRDPKQIVEELRALLASHEYAPPYLLVGHSTGGTYMELFAKSHPDEVLGAVLVDPRHRDWLSTCQAAQLDGCGIPESTLETQAPSTIAEYHAFAMASNQIRAAGPFGSCPVRVLTATDHDGWAAAQESLWQSMLASLAVEAVDGRQIIVQGAGHHIQLDRPDVVVNTILAILRPTSP
ncbi:MAG TPA: alpha/beta hydrolase [Polyangia bacterium]|jgi:pimeloyl-ACP methyl ester carboxylesterase